MEKSLASTHLPYPVAVATVWLLVGLLLTLCDRFFHVNFGVLRYTDPIFTGQAWWVFPGFVFAATSMYLSAKFLFVQKVSTPTPAQIGTSLTLFVASYAASGIFLAWPQALLIGFVATWFLRLGFARDRAVTFVFGLILAVMGCFIEGLLMLTGNVAYSAPEIFHVPWWLGGLYLHGAFVVLQLVRFVEEQYGRV